MSKDLKREEREKNLIEELKELCKNETEGEWHKVKNGKKVKERIEKGRRRGGSGRRYRRGRRDLE